MTTAAWIFLGGVWLLIGVTIFISMKKIVSHENK